MTDIFLYQGEPNPNDIRLGDPTTTRKRDFLNGWLQPLGTIARPVGLSLAVIVASGLLLPPAPPAAAQVVTVTADQWLRPFAAPPRILQPYGDWLAQPFVPPPPPQYVTFSTDSAFVRVKTLHYQSQVQPVVVPAAPNTNWLIRWDSPPRYLLGLLSGSPFVPKEAVLDNTSTPDKWLLAFNAAVPHSWPTKQLAPFVPKEATSENTVTPDKWLQRWQGPPRYLLSLPGGQPFVPREAVLDNTATPDKWMRPFYQAVPVPKPVVTQPFYGYPYVSQSNLTTTLEWLSAWQGPPRIVPPKVLAQPFVPKEAVLENTVTPDRWLQPFYAAVPVPKPVVTQPFYGYPYVSASNLTTTLEWMQAWQGPPRIVPPQILAHTLVLQPPPSQYVVFSVDSSFVTVRTLHYQSLVQPVVFGVSVPPSPETMVPQGIVHVGYRLIPIGY